MKISIMQPYFYPYKNYFKLIDQSDYFVILDDVQFPRRGWVHRNVLTNKFDSNKFDWITLPINKHPINTMIKDLEFDKNKIDSFIKKTHKFKFFESKINLYPEIKKNIFNFEKKPIKYLIDNLTTICEILSIKTKILICSKLNISNKLNFRDRFIKIVKSLEGSKYLNLPGGKMIYDTNFFLENKIELSFINEQKEKKISILDTLK